MKTGHAFLLMVMLLALMLGANTATAGNIWIDLYGESIHDCQDIQSMADSYYSTARAGLSLKPADFYLSYMQYGLYNATENRIAYVGIGVKKGLVLGPVFLEPFLDYHRDPEFSTNIVRIGFFTTWTIKEW